MSVNRTGRTATWLFTQVQVRQEGQRVFRDRFMLHSNADRDQGQCRRGAHGDAPRENPSVVSRQTHDLPSGCFWRAGPRPERDFAAQETNKPVRTTAKPQHWE